MAHNKGNNNAMWYRIYDKLPKRNNDNITQSVQVLVYNPTKESDDKERYVVDYYLYEHDDWAAYYLTEGYIYWTYLPEVDTTTTILPVIDGEE